MCRKATSQWPQNKTTITVTAAIEEPTRGRPNNANHRPVIPTSRRTSRRRHIDHIDLVMLGGRRGQCSRLLTRDREESGNHGMGGTGVVSKAGVVG